VSLALSSGVCAVTKSQNTRRQEVLDAYLDKHGDDALLPGKSEAPDSRLVSFLFGALVFLATSAF